MVYLKIILFYIVIFAINAVCIAYLKWMGKKGKANRITGTAAPETTVPENNTIPEKSNLPEDKIPEETKPMESPIPPASVSKPERAPETPPKEKTDAQQKKRTLWIVAAGILVLIVLAVVIGRQFRKPNPEVTATDSSLTATPEIAEDSSVQDSVEDDDDQDNYDWLQGTWVGETPYGTVELVLSGDHIKSMDNSGVSEGTFTIQDGEIYAIYEGGTQLNYEIDSKNYRIGYGKGVFLYKGSGDTQLNETDDDGDVPDNEIDQDQEKPQKEKADTVKHAKGVQEPLHTNP